MKVASSSFILKVPKENKCVRKGGTEMTFNRNFDEEFINKAYMRVFRTDKDNKALTKTSTYSHMPKISWTEALEILKKESAGRKAPRIGESFEN